MKKIFFLGGNRIGVLCLKQLIQWKKANVIGVMPRFSDKGQEPNPNQWNASVRKYAKDKGIRIFDFKSVNEPKFRKILISLKPDYLLSVQYDLIVKQEILRIPNIGSVNIHFAPLPKYRGCFPISWAIIDGNPAGVTMHWIDKGIDTGKIIKMRKIFITPKDTAKTVYDKATAIGFKIFREIFPKLLSGNTPQYSQREKEAIYHPKGYPYDRWINWNWQAAQIARFVRALTFPPYPSARAQYEDREFEIVHPVRVLAGKCKNNYQPGEIISTRKNALTVAAGRGFINIRKLILDANNVLKVNKFLKQIPLKKGDILKSG